MIPVFSITYFPNLLYFAKILSYKRIIIEQHEHYQKQTHRNRTEILGANGIIKLIIPVHYRNNQTIDSVQISFNQAWQRQHWRTICSAYRSAAYFEHFEEEVYNIVFHQAQTLYHYNLFGLRQLLSIFSWRGTLEETTAYELKAENKDADTSMSTNTFRVKPYYQIFQHKFGFTPNLSILDLLFNEGTKLATYLTPIDS